MTVWLTHSKIRLALHPLRKGEGRPLLLLHGLGERSPAGVPRDCEAWPGPVFALDLTGHGASTVPVGGGYTAECLLGDVDAAITHLGSVTLRGRGLGAYLALLAAGARPGEVRGTILVDGPGLAGGGSRPGTPVVLAIDPEAVAPPDPFAMAELSRDVRPPDYATAFVHQATQLSELECPISVCAVERPEWLRAVTLEPGVEESTHAEALARYGV